MEASGVVRIRTKRRLVEVFSIQFLDYEAKFEWTYGTVLLKTPTIPHTLSIRRIGHPQIIDQDGFFRLTGPESGIEANDDDISFVPFLFNMEFPTFHRSPRNDIWRADMEDNDGLYDQLKLHRQQNAFGIIEMNYAIYRDGTEVHLDATVIDWEGETIEIYGTVGVRNSKITDPKARSLLLNNTSEEAISVHPGKVNHLPLSRKVTVLPLESVLIVDVCLLRGSTIFAQGTLRFDAKLTGNEELILFCNPGRVKVKVTWVNEQAHREAGKN